MPGTRNQLPVTSFREFLKKKCNDEDSSRENNSTLICFELFSD